jgi:hypothetical protein
MTRSLVLAPVLVLMLILAGIAAGLRRTYSLLDVEFSGSQAVLTLIGVPVALAVCWFAIVVAWAVWS